MKLILLCCALIPVTILAADGDAVDLKAKGIAALKESQQNADAIVPAAKAFLQAADLYTTAGADSDAQEMNSYLYWCKKKMNIKQMDKFLEAIGKGDQAEKAVKKLEAVSAAPAASDAEKYFANADGFAKSNPNEHLLIAIRYFEVADRFKGTDISMKAQEKSLAEMQLVSEKKASSGAAGGGTSKTATAAHKSGKTIDLLALVKPEKHGLTGIWEMKNKCLCVGASETAHLELPYAPPEEYDFKVVFARATGSNHILQILATSGGFPFDYSMDVFGKGEFGFDSIDGKYANENSSTNKVAKLTNGQRYTSVVKVRKGGVTAYLNNVLVCQHKTKDYSEMSLAQWWKLSKPELIGVGAQQSATIFYSIEVTEVSGEGQIQANE